MLSNFIWCELPLVSFLLPKEGFISNEKEVFFKKLFLGTLNWYPKPRKLLLKDVMFSNEVFSSFSDFVAVKLTYKDALFFIWYGMLVWSVVFRKVESCLYKENLSSGDILELNIYGVAVDSWSSCFSLP